MLTEADLETVRAQAEQGDENSQFRLAVHYLTDTRTAPQPQTAYEWAKRAAQSNHQDAAEFVAKVPTSQLYVVPHTVREGWTIPGLVIAVGLGGIMLLIWALSPTGIVTSVGTPTAKSISPLRQTGDINIKRPWTLPPHPAIASMTQILAQAHQTITITGSGFGNQAPYNGDSRYILITDLTRNWNAGNAGDFVTLSVTRWTDTQITIQGFTGAYGHMYSLNVGDQVRIQVWNAQTGAGPASTMVSVAAPQPTTLPETSNPVPPAGSRSDTTVPPSEDEEDRDRPVLRRNNSTAVATADLAGTWGGTSRSSQGTTTFECVLQQTGARVTGWARESMEGSRELLSDVSGVLEGRVFRFIVRYRSNGLEVPCNGTIAADDTKVSGTCSFGSQTSYWQMQKTSQWGLRE